MRSQHYCCKKQSSRHIVSKVIEIQMIACYLCCHFSNIKYTLMHTNMIISGKLQRNKLCLWLRKGTQLSAIKERFGFQ